MRRAPKSRPRGSAWPGTGDCAKRQAFNKAQVRLDAEQKSHADQCMGWCVDVSTVPPPPFYARYVGIPAAEFATTR